MSIWKKNLKLAVCALLGGFCACAPLWAEQAEVKPQAPAAAQDSKRRRPLLIDTRDASDYAREHIGRAINIRQDDIEEMVFKYRAFEDKGRKILIYASTEDEARAAEAVFVRLGYFNIVVLGGMEEAQIKVRDAISTFEERREALRHLREAAPKK